MKKLNSLASLSWVLAIVLILSNGLLIKQNLQLRALVQKLESEQRIQIGDKFDAFPGKGLDGKSTEVRFAGGDLKRVVLFSSVSCVFCKKQNPKWNRLIEKLNPEKYEVVEIFRESEPLQQISDYLKANRFSAGNSAQAYLIADDLLRAEKLNSTPITLIVGKDGTIEKAWFGLWSNSTTAEVSSFLGIAIQ